MGIDNEGNQQTASAVTQPSELLGHRYVVPDDYVPRVLSDLAQERAESRGRVQYAVRVISNSETNWRNRQQREAQEASEHKRRKPS